jgi:hypothetical protein
MIKIKFNIIHSIINYDKETKELPFIEIGFNQNNSGQITQPTSRIYYNDYNEYNIDCHYNMNQISTACLLLYTCGPNFNDDEPPTVVYNRVSKNIISLCNNLKSQIYEIKCKNMINEIIGNIIINIIIIQNDLQELKNEIINPIKLIDNTIKIQDNYDEIMYNYLKLFKNKWDGTEEMTLLNDFFDINGKTLFYIFEDFKIPKTNSKYWQKLFDYVLNLKYGSECNNKNEYHYDKYEYFNFLNINEKMSVLCDMISIISTSCYYLTDIARKKNGTKEFTEDFCNVFHTWSGDCEDLVQSCVQMFKIFQSIDNNKIEGKELKFLHSLSIYYILFNCLSCADRASTGSLHKKLSAHMCGLLIRKKFLFERIILKNNSISNFDNLKNKYFEPETILNNNNNEKLPNIIIIEGTGSVKGIPISNFITTSIKNYSFQESIKERIFIPEKNIPFYLYFFQILTNVFIDNYNIPIQSFILTYPQNDNQKINEKWNNNSYTYGIHINDLLYNDNILFIPTPLINNNQINNSKMISSMNISRPPCYINENDLFLSRFKNDTIISPIISSEQLEYLKLKYKHLFIYNIKKNNIEYVLVPPKNLEDTLYKINSKDLYGIQLYQLQYDLWIFIVWILK